MKRLIITMVVLILLSACAGATPTRPGLATIAPQVAPSVTSASQSSIATSVMATKAASAPSNASGAATVTPRPRANDTPLPTVEPSAYFQNAAKALSSYHPPESDPSALHDALAQGTIEYLRASASPDENLVTQRALALLQSALGQIQNLSREVRPQVAAIHLRDSEGGSEDLVLISMQKLMGLPIVAVHRLGQTYDVLPSKQLLGGMDSAGSNFSAGAVSGIDVTGDDIGEAVFTYEMAGASALTTRLNVMRWSPDEHDLKTIFRADLINWAGESTFEFVPTGKGQDIKLSYPSFGIFDHKLLAHPRATELWAYDTDRDQFVKQTDAIDPPQTVRQQLNVAEELFRRGYWEKAVDQFARAWNDKTLNENEGTEPKPAWRAFARFRQGELLALLGRDDEAKAALADAGKSGGTLARLADAFVKNFSDGDHAVRAWAALPNALDLYKELYEGTARDLDLPASATDIFYKGEIVAAFLNAHPDAATQTATTFATLATLGFQPTNSITTDLDGDGVPEFLCVTQEGSASPNHSQVLWLVYRGDGRWLTRAIVQAETLVLDPPALSLPGSKGHAVRLKLPTNRESPERSFTWDRSHIVDLNAQTLEPLGREVRWPVVGGENRETEF